jgi:hypothetical protein
VTTDGLVAEVSHHDAWQYARLTRHARSRRGVRMCYRQLLPPSLMVRGVDSRDDKLIDVVAPLLWL